MATQEEISDRVSKLIGEELNQKFSYLSYAEMADVPELEQYREELLRAEADWFAAEEID